MTASHLSFVSKPLAGAGINHTNAAQIVAETGIRSVHTSCRGTGTTAERVNALGFGQTGSRADRQEVAKLRAVLDRCPPRLTVCANAIPKSEIAKATQLEVAKHLDLGHERTRRMPDLCNQCSQGHKTE